MDEPSVSMIRFAAEVAAKARSGLTSGAGEHRSGALDAVLSVLDGRTLASLTDWQLEYLERGCAAVIKAIRLLQAKRWGFQRRGWDANGPGTLKYGPGAWASPSNGWGDHVYTIRYAGHTTYVSEPYSLHEDGLRELLALSEQGWEVTIRGDRSTHFPGHTFAIWLKRPARRRAAARTGA